MWRQYQSHQRNTSGISCQNTEKTDTLRYVIREFEDKIKHDKELIGFVTRHDKQTHDKKVNTLGDPTQSYTNGPII